MIHFIALTLGLVGAFLLVGTLLGVVRYNTAAGSMLWSALSAAAVIWALAELGVV